MDPFRVPPAVGQFSHDAGGRALFELAFGFVHNGGGGRNDAADVLQNEAPRTAIVCEVDDAEEEAGSCARVESGTPASDGHVLARESRNDCVHRSAKASCWQASKIAAPHRRCIQESCFHERNQLAGCRGFPLAIGNCSEVNAEMAERRSDSFVKHADSGAKANRIEDGTSHIHLISSETADNSASTRRA